MKRTTSTSMAIELSNPSRSRSAGGQSTPVDFHRRIAAVITLSLLVSCSRVPTAAKVVLTSPTGTPLAISSQSGASATTSEIFSPTPSLQPTPRSPTNTPVPAGLNPQGPYVIFEGDAGIWITNPDGGFLIRVYDRGIQNEEQDLHAAISSRGDRLALVVAGADGPDLVAIDLPGGKAATLTHLQDIKSSFLMVNTISPKAFAYYAIANYPNPAWQPDPGNLLAFIGAASGPTADLYTYDFAAKKIRQLLNDPSQTIDPIWSPDGKYLLLFGVSWLPPYGATLVEYRPMDGLWAVRMSDGVVIPQPAPKGTYRNLIGWQDASHYLLYDTDEQCTARNLRAVDVATAEETPIADFCFYAEPAWSPENDAVIFSIDSSCSCSLEEGTYLILPKSNTPQKITSKKAYDLTWLPESGLFQAYPEGLFSPDGSKRYDPPMNGSSYKPAISKSGREAWEVIENRIHRVKVKFPDGTWHAILEGNVGAMVWDPVKGDSLLIALEDGSLYAAYAPDFVPREMGSMGSAIRRAAWVP
jgi:hypothetical protein